jgi:hypothetical protein
VLGQLGEAHPAVAGQQRDDGAVDLLHPDTVATCGGLRLLIPTGTGVKRRASRR